MARIVSWPYKRNGQDLSLQFDTATGQVFIPNIGWSDDIVAKSLGLQQQALSKPTEAPKTPPFGDATKHTGRWIPSPYRGKRIK